MKLQLLDELIALGHEGVRSTDCIVSVEWSGTGGPDVARAQKLFPKTAAFTAAVSDYPDLSSFLAKPLATPLHIEVARIGSHYAFKMSHVLGDAVSMLLFIKAMFGEEVSGEELQLKEFPAKKDTPYRDVLNSRLWPRKGIAGGSRKFLTDSIEHGVRDASWNDVLLLCLLDCLPYHRKSIWVPVNVRKSFWKGFGNGLSRMRIYPPRGVTVKEKLAHIRKQKQEAMKNGEVALPPSNFSLEDPVKKFLYQLWVKRPWADWGTISLSHVTNSNGFLDNFRQVIGISSLMPAHNAALFAVTRGETTDFTLTYDPACVTDEEAQKLLRGFLEQLRAHC